MRRLMTGRIEEDVMSRLDVVRLSVHQPNLKSLEPSSVSWTLLIVNELPAS